MEKYIDLVVTGLDFSGTTTQIGDMISYFKSIQTPVKDLRGTEIDVLFHSEELAAVRKKLGEGEFLNLTEYTNKIKEWREAGVTSRDTAYFLYYVNQKMGGYGMSQDLKVGSMVKNDITTYINPNSADVWIMEEPPRRGAGQECRVFEQNRSKFGSRLNGISAAYAHQAYRSSEFFRFRKHLRDNGKTIIRSRSEDSACYQIYHPKNFHSGIQMNDYLKLPGHQVAFANPPTHIFTVCGPKDWDVNEYIKLKESRTANRILDDHEKNSSYQLLVNQRYATDWLEKLYQKGCFMYGSKEPAIVKFDIYNSKEKTRELMNQKLKEILIAHGKAA